MHGSCTSSRPGISVSTGEGEFEAFDNFTPNFATGKWRETEAALTGSVNC